MLSMPASYPAKVWVDGRTNKDRETNHIGSTYPQQCGDNLSLAGTLLRTDCNCGRSAGTNEMIGPQLYPFHELPFRGANLYIGLCVIDEASPHPDGMRDDEC